MWKTNSKIVAFTICAKNYLASALICRDSFIQQNPNIDFIIFLADAITDVKELNLIKDIDCIIAAQELKQMGCFKTSNALEEMAYKYNVLEFVVSLKPFCIEYLLWVGYDKVLYFDADIAHFSSIHQACELLDNYECIVTPHLMSPYPKDDKIQQDIDVQRAGIYNAGFIGVSLSQNVIDIMQWWQNKTRYTCFNDNKNFLCGDQTWVTLFPAFMHTSIIKHPGYNAGYWNLHERKYKQERGQWLVNDDPLVFYHYSGLEYKKLYQLSKFQNRYSLSNRPDVAPLYHIYIEQLHNYKFKTYSKLPYYYKSCQGKEIKDRRLIGEAFKKTANPWLHNHKFGFNAIGYFPYVLGLADSARSFIQKVNATGVPYAIKPLIISYDHIKIEEEKEFGLCYTQRPKYDTSIFFLNLDQAQLTKNNDPYLFKKRNIGAFWWEVEDDLPHKDNLSCVEEILCFTEFTHKIFKEWAPNHKVHRLPYPYMPAKQSMYNNDAGYCKQRLGINPDEFVFYFNFDYASSFGRKNPLAIMQAFTKACRGKPKTRLVLKTMRSELHPTEAHRIESACKEYEIDNQVTLIDGALARTDMYSLTNMCDCYISLHKSEGLGIGIVDAMYFGKPVIATDYGGNLEFMNGDNSLPVKYKKEIMQQDVFKGYYHKGASWANPDVDDAVSKMIEIMENKDLREKISGRARQTVIEYSNTHRFIKSFYDLMIGE
jgi:glycosyltransferase involved in cell wall biosynthesis